MYETDAAHRLVSMIGDALRREGYEYDAASNVISLGRVRGSTLAKAIAFTNSAGTDTTTTSATVWQPQRPRQGVGALHLRQF